MSKVKFLIGFLATAGLALAPNFFSGFFSPWMDPGNNDTMRTYMIVGAGLIFLLCYLLLRWLQGRDENPQDSLMAGWFETVATITLALSTALMLCVEWDSRSRGQGVSPLWIVPAGIALATLITQWPIERQQKYNRLSNYIWQQLRMRDVVSIDELIRGFADTPERNVGIPVAETEQGREYKYLISWFLKNNATLGIRLKEGIIIWDKSYMSGQGSGNQRNYHGGR